MCLELALGFSSFISNMEETHIDSADPEKLLKCPYDKKNTRSGTTGFLIISSAERIILMSQINWLLIPSMLTTRFLVLKSVIISQVVMINIVFFYKHCIEQDVVNQTRNLGQETLAEYTWQCPPCDKDWDKDLWEQTSNPYIWDTANYCGNNTPASNIAVEHKSNLASGMHVPMSLPYVLP
uniref:Uncharacterized protein n=1 Tax=Canis lupus familiaris TaxID=9615 RepID=A0A8I3PQN4_CANLF